MKTSITLATMLLFVAGFTANTYPGISGSSQQVGIERLHQTTSKDKSVFEKSDIILFMVDQLSAKWLESAWEGVCPAPNIEKLKEMGTAFPHCFTSNPVCCLARATISTGLTTRGHGVLENGYRLEPELPTFMKVLQKHGWRTGGFGKVHLKPHYAGLYPDYKPYGFDVTHITEDPRGGEWLDWVEKIHIGHYEAALATIWPTILDMAVLEMPRQPVEGIYLKKAVHEIRVLPGNSLLPVWKGEPVSNWREAAYCESYNKINSSHPGQ